MQKAQKLSFGILAIALAGLFASPNATGQFGPGRLITRHFEKDVRTEELEDLNRDGKADLWCYFDERLWLLRKEYDTDFDGEVDWREICSPPDGEQPKVYLGNVLDNRPYRIFSIDNWESYFEAGDKIARKAPYKHPQDEDGYFGADPPKIQLSPPPKRKLTAEKLVDGKWADTFTYSEKFFHYAQYGNDSASYGWDVGPDALWWWNEEQSLRLIERPERPDRRETAQHSTITWKYENGAPIEMTLRSGPFLEGSEEKGWTETNRQSPDGLNQIRFRDGLPLTHEITNGSGKRLTTYRDGKALTDEFFDPAGKLYARRTYGQPREWEALLDGKWSGNFEMDIRDRDGTLANRCVYQGGRLVRLEIKHPDGENMGTQDTKYLKDGTVEVTAWIAGKSTKKSISQSNGKRVTEHFDRNGQLLLRVRMTQPNAGMVFEFADIAASDQQPGRRIRTMHDADGSSVTEERRIDDAARRTGELMSRGSYDQQGNLLETHDYESGKLKEHKVNRAGVWVTETFTDNWYDKNQTLKFEVDGKPSFEIAFSRMGKRWNQSFKDNRGAYPWTTEEIDAKGGVISRSYHGPAGLERMEYLNERGEPIRRTYYGRNGNRDRDELLVDGKWIGDFAEDHQPQTTLQFRRTFEGGRMIREEKYYNGSKSEVTKFPTPTTREVGDGQFTREWYWHEGNQQGRLLREARDLDGDGVPDLKVDYEKLTIEQPEAGRQ